MSNLEFRAWDREDYEFLECSTSDMFKMIEDGRQVVIEQFTGLLDCDGVKIFEGDILRDDIEDCATSVFFSDESLCLTTGSADIGYYKNEESFVKVIGNIHQHKYLLEESK